MTPNQYKEFVVKDEKAFRLKIKQWKALSPSNLNSIEFIQECIDKDGEVDFTSVYNFLMTDDEVKMMASKLMEIIE